LYFVKTVNLSVNNKFLYALQYGKTIDVNVNNNGIPYTQGIST